MDATTRPAAMSAAQLRAWMNSTRYTNRTLARDLGVTRGAVEHWLAGQRPITRRTVLALESLERRRTIGSVEP